MRPVRNYIHEEADMSKDKERTVCLKEIAHKLGVSTKTVRRYNTAGKIKTFQAGGAGTPIKMRQVDLDRLMRGK
jgi:hypothetical protein